MSTIVVNSAQRTNLADPQKLYTFKVWSELRDIRKMDLVRANIPRSMESVIAGFNNSIIITVTDVGPTDVTQTITIPAGYYTASSLAAELNTLLAAAFPTVAVAPQVTLDATTGRLTWVGDALTLLKTFEGNEHVLRLLGFPPEFGGVETFFDWDVGGTAVTRAMPNVINLSYPNYLLVNVNVRNSGSSHTINTDGNSYSFVVPCGTDVAYFEYTQWKAGEEWRQTDYVQSTNLLELDIEIRPPDELANVPFDFHGADHILVFECR